MNKIVKIQVTTPDGKDQSVTSVVIEQNRGGGQVRVDGRDITTNTKEEQTFELSPGQRLVLDAWPAEEAVMDHEQGAAVLKSNQSAPRVADSAVAGKTPSDLRRTADEMERAQRDADLKAKSATAESEAIHKKNLDQIEKDKAQVRTPNADVAKNPSTTGQAVGAQIRPGQATPASPMKSSKDIR